ncbi:EAL domain-containing protein [Viridibacterium curvum]|uniref:EAL domain-containing protein n=2 Tax=Viridibacterium curvum TaxID=1101404 RepID=A0ABP9QIZ9_9RHOO
MGVLSLIASELPFQPWQDFMETLLGETWRDHIELVSRASFGFVSVCLVASISHTLNGLIPQRDEFGENNPITTVLVALVCYLLIVMPGNGLLGPEQTGARGTFLAVFSAIAATELFLFLRRRRRLQIAWLSDADPQLPDTLRAILPAFVTVSVFLVLHELLTHFSGTADSLFDAALFNLFGSIENDLMRALLYCLLSQILWFFGMHGTNMLTFVEQTWFQAATDANAQAMLLGNAPYEIVTKPFFDTCVVLGGAGATTGLLIALFLGSARGSNMRNVGKLALLPALFNINEVLLFGLPVVLNPVFLLPFLCIPLLLTLLSYFVLSAGWVPLSTHAVSWMTPLGINAWLATGSWTGLALQAFNLAISVLLYLPFVRLAEARQRAASNASLRQLIASLEDTLGSYRQRIVNRQDAIGRLARQLLADIDRDIDTDRVRLVYQPKLDRAGRVTGVEALLRWRHNSYGSIPPNVLIGIAEDAGGVGELGRWTLATACQQLAEWKAAGIEGVSMAVNLSPLQLADPALLQHVQQSLRDSGIQPAELELEITENRNVGNDPQSNASIAALNEMGVHLAMDDFGMGYSSLLYMRRFRISAIKLDGSLTREVEQNASCRDIISQVSQLCQNMGVRVVAEYVETESQSQLLQQLGCTELQGYLYSPPLEAAACQEFIRQRNASAPAHPVNAEIFHATENV